MRKVLAHDRGVDHHAVRHIKKGPAGEERRVQRGESIAVGADQREQARLDQLGVILRGLAQGFEDHTLRQRRRKDKLLAVQVLELRELARVEPADVGAPPLLIGLARDGQAFEAVQRALPALAQPVGLPLEHPQGFGGESHRYPTEPSISSWMSRFSSTAYSSGSSLVNGSMKPLTIIVSASLRVMPRLIR